MEDLEKILKQLYLVSGLNMSIFDINQKILAGSLTVAGPLILKNVDYNVIFLSNFLF